MADKPQDKDEATKDKADKATEAKSKQADKAKKEAKAPKAKRPATPARKGMPVGAWIAICAVALVAGVLIGKFALGPSVPEASGKTTLAEGELDSVVATYTYNGNSFDLTARQVIQEQSSLDSAKQDDGTYTAPSADAILSTARSTILEKAAEAEGISVSDDDLATYAQQTLGSSDYDSIASSYNMDSDTVKELLRQSAMMKQLKDKKVGESPSAPEAPQTADDLGVDSSASTKEWADYIIGLAGDEWDADNNTWKTNDDGSKGDYATALSDYQITNDGATYEAAQAAYYVAYQKYSSSASDVTTQWTNYVNGLLCNASIQIKSLTA